MKEIEVELPESLVKRWEEIAEMFGMTAEELLSKVLTIILEKDLKNPERRHKFEEFIEETKAEAKRRGISLDELLRQDLEEWAQDEEYWNELKKRLSE